VFKLHGLPDRIISDRGPQFVAAFCEQFPKRLRIQRSLSSAFHLQTDGKTKRVNSVIEQYLRCFIDYRQTNWSSLLPLAEFAYNNSFQSAIRQTPFFVTYGYHPGMDFLPIRDVLVPSADGRVKEFQDNFKHLQSELIQAKETAKKFADLKRNPSPSLNINDYVWLSRKNIASARPNSKLDFKRLGPLG
jgi:hypothetical protein